MLAHRSNHTRQETIDLVLPSVTTHRCSQLKMKYCSNDEVNWVSILPIWPDLACRFNCRLQSRKMNGWSSSLYPSFGTHLSTILSLIRHIILKWYFRSRIPGQGHRRSNCILVHQIHLTVKLRHKRLDVFKVSITTYLDYGTTELHRQPNDCHRDTDATFITNLTIWTRILIVKSHNIRHIRCSLMVVYWNTRGTCRYVHKLALRVLRKGPTLPVLYIVLCNS